MRDREVHLCGVEGAAVPIEPVVGVPAPVALSIGRNGRMLSKKAFEVSAFRGVVATDAVATLIPERFGNPTELNDALVRRNRRTWEIGQLGPASKEAGERHVELATNLQNVLNLWKVFPVHIFPNQITRHQQPRSEVISLGFDQRMCRELGEGIVGPSIRYQTLSMTVQKVVSEFVCDREENSGMMGSRMTPRVVLRVEAEQEPVADVANSAIKGVTKILPNSMDQFLFGLENPEWINGRCPKLIRFGDLLAFPQRRFLFCVESLPSRVTVHRSGLPRRHPVLVPPRFRVA